MSFKYVVSTLVLLAAMGWHRAAAECVEAPQTRAFGGADIVFRGKVIAVDELTKADPGDRVPVKVSRDGDPSIITFQTQTVWKGRAEPVIRLFILGRPYIVGASRFQIGGEYVIYGVDEVNQNAEDIRSFSANGRVYSAGIYCTLRIRADVAKEVRLLGKGKSTVKKQK